MSKYVNETAAAKSLSAYVILNRKGEHVATVKAHFSNGGTCLVNVHDFNSKDDGFQHAKAGGYGYDKFTAALRGMKIDGHAMSDHSEHGQAPRPPKGRKTYPADFKLPKGYELANYASISKATGSRLWSDHWKDEARKALSIPADTNLSDDEFETLFKKARQLEKDWQQSDDCESGYTSCFRKSGLDYLKALGYRVIQAV